ncbi:MAG: GldG family protein [Christensenella sp.]|uniref:GldG family protein n=1 Tax=Christensenella sp. TaxID=1935934 RepID=UPI002B20A8E6|nr:GldG family protein [Christensenella sp.]MEA5003507.1 GldG family protein [Christensenella sp.]
MKKEQSVIAAKKKKFMVTSIIWIVVVALIVVFGVQLAYRVPWTYDMTGQKLFVLSEETKNVTDGLTDTVKIGAVYSDSNQDAMVSALLKEYEKISPNIQVEFLDVDKNPGMLAGYELGDVKAVPNGTIIVNGNGRYKVIAPTELFASGETGNQFYGESEITGAIRYVTAETLPKIYFLQGHDELKTGTDTAKAVALLERDAYAVDTLSLLEKGSVPEDASMVIAVSPAEDLSDEEAAALRTYLEAGGKFLLSVDPTLSTNTDKLKNFGEITRSYGIDIANNFVFEEDQSYYLTTSNMYLIPRYGEHAITEQMINDQKYVVLPLVRGLTEVEHADDVKLTPLLQSSPSSWMRTDVSIAENGMTEKDVQGPINLAYAVEQNGPRMVVIGDSNFMTDGNLEMQGNSNLFINSVDWLNGGRDSAMIAGKVINSNSMVVRGADFVKLMIICCVVMPLVMFVGAIFVWRMKKNK